MSCKADKADDALAMCSFVLLCREVFTSRYAVLHELKTIPMASTTRLKSFTWQFHFTKYKWTNDRCNPQRRDDVVLKLLDQRKLNHEEEDYTPEFVNEVGHRVRKGPRQTNCSRSLRYA